MIIKFYEKRRIFFGISAAIMLIGLICLFAFGVQLDVQFKGGVMVQYSVVSTPDLEDMADVAESLLGRAASVHEATDLSTGDRRIVMTLAGNGGLTGEEMNNLNEALQAAYPDAGLAQSSTSVVEPFIGQMAMRRGMYAIAISAVLVVVYVWISFRRISGLSAGVMALAALVHDLLIAFFTFVIFRIPIGDSFIAVALTILGYSINDTIVIYDRIRENRRLEPKLPVEELVNKSISQSLTRSIYTNAAVFISVFLIFIFATANNLDSVQSFALPMSIGAISGCYSTICIAGPLWVMWQKHKENRSPKKA